LLDAKFREPCLEGRGGHGGIYDPRKYFPKPQAISNSRQLVPFPPLPLQSRSIIILIDIEGKTTKVISFCQRFNNCIPAF
jgi:hypothetical protein